MKQFICNAPLISLNKSLQIYAESFDPVSIIILEPSLLLLQDLHNLTGDTVIKADTEKMLYFDYSITRISSGKSLKYVWLPPAIYL